MQDAAKKVGTKPGAHWAGELRERVSNVTGIPGPLFLREGFEYHLYQNHQGAF